MNNQEQIPKMFCGMCGGRIDRDSKFCPLCGVKLVGTPGAAPAPNIAANGTPVTSGPWSRNVLMTAGDGGPRSKVLRTDREKVSIKTITFVDSLNAPPLYTTWDVSADYSGRVIAWTRMRKDAFYDLFITGEGGVTANSNSLHLFSHFINLEGVCFHSHFHTTDVTDMRSMFCNCKSLTTVDVCSLHTSKVMNMENMFCDCKNLTHLDISSFDISNTTEVGYMFSGCDNLTDLKIGNLTPEQINAMRIPEGVNIHR